MKSRRPARPARRDRSIWVRVVGYGGAALLAAAAVGVLLMPLLDGGKGDAGTAGAQTTASPSAAPPGGQAGGPGGSGAQATPTGPGPQRDGSGRPDPGGQGGGPQIPDPGGAGSLTWCPQGTAFYRAARDGVDVVIRVASSGAIRAELALRGGRAPKSQQTTVRGGGPHTFRFTGVAPQLVQRVKVTTVSVGVAMQTCYARAAA